MGDVGIDRIVRPDELRRHSKRGDCWICIGDTVFDVSRFADHHPGGEIIFHFAGRDATEVFRANHDPNGRIVQAKLKRLRVGEIDRSAAAGSPAASVRKGARGAAEDDAQLPRAVAPLSAAEKDFRRLADAVREEGLYETSYVFYAGKIAVVMAFLAGAVALTVSSWARGHWWAPWAAGFCLSQFWHQSAFVVHDALHNAITHTRSIDQAIGWLFGTVFISIPSLWWRDNHHMHHCLTNALQVTETTEIPGSGVDKPKHWNGPAGWHGDPQMYYVPIWRTAKNMTSVTPCDGPLWTVLHKIQHLTFLPLHLVIGRWNIYVLAIINLFKMGSGKEVLGLAMYWTWFSALASQWAHDSRELAIFLLVSHTLAGIMHLQLNLTHFAMPMLPRDEIDRMGFAAAQVGTARNIDYKWYAHWYHGGLDLQIEHHLFPMLPRHNLKIVRDKYVLPFCKKHNIPYTSEGFFSSIWTVLEDLHEISRDPLGDKPHAE